MVLEQQLKLQKEEYDIRITCLSEEHEKKMQIIFEEHKAKMTLLKLKNLKLKLVLVYGLNEFG